MMKPLVLYYSPEVFSQMSAAMGLANLQPETGSIAGLVVLTEARELVPPWLNEIADSPEYGICWPELRGHSYVVLPTVTDVDDALTKDGKSPPIDAVLDTHRMLVRHELTHWLRAQKGWYDGIGEPRPWNPLRVAWEEFVANWTSVVLTPNLHRALRLIWFLAIPFHVLLSVKASVGGKKWISGLAWYMSFGLVGTNPRDAYKPMADITEPPEDSRARLHWDIVQLRRQADKVARRQLIDELDGQF
jgi:hypothetical protein